MSKSCLKPESLQPWVLLILAVSYVGLSSAHQSSIFEADDVKINEHYTRMAELHRQYDSNEITFEEFHDNMENDEFHGEEMSCHTEYGNTGMGFHMMGMM